MKKIAITTLFSTLLLVGGISSFADETDVVPVTPDVGEETVPITPDVGDSTDVIGGSTNTETDQPTPATPVISDAGGEGTPIGGETTGGTVNSEVPASPTDTGITEQPTTTSSTSTETAGNQTDDVTSPQSNAATSEDKTEKTKDENKKTDTQTTAPAKQVTVSVNPQGQITKDVSQGTSVPIVTSNVGEISHVPTLATPLKVASGQSIVGVLDGVPLVQNEQGELVKDSSIPVKILPSGNIEVKTADGQTKVLPKTGEKLQIGISILGMMVTVVSGYFIYLKKQGKKWTQLVKK